MHVNISVIKIKRILLLLILLSGQWSLRIEAKITLHRFFSFIVLNKFCHFYYIFCSCSDIILNKIAKHFLRLFNLAYASFLHYALWVSNCPSLPSTLYFAITSATSLLLLFSLKLSHFCPSYSHLQDHISVSLFFIYKVTAQQWLSCMRLFSCCFLSTIFIS